MQNTSKLFRRAVAQYRLYSHLTRSSPSPLRTIALPRFNPLPRSRVHCQPVISSVRYQSSLTVPQSEAESQQNRPTVPSYQLTFTCKPCGHRSAHNVSKQGYHHGTVLITCPSCKNRHVISDHLKIFMDEASTLEDILQRSAGTDKDLSKLLKKGRLGQREGQLVGNEGEEDIEFWDDGTETKHQPKDGN